MALDISIGGLAASLEHGRDEDVKYYRKQFREVNRVLAAHGLPPHVEPETLPTLKSRSDLNRMPYSWIHYLRRAYAYARQAPHEFAPLPEGQSPTADRRLDAEMYTFAESHLVCHSDTEGYYVPIDFPEPIGDSRKKSLIGNVIGSSQGAMRELIKTAPLLGIPVENGVLPDAVADEINAEEDGPLYIERKAWLLLFDALSHSLEHKAAVAFC